MMDRDRGESGVGERPLGLVDVVWEWHGDEDGPMRPRHVQPEVVLEHRQQPGSAISAASWCVTCPWEGAKSPACCGHKQWLELQPEAIERRRLQEFAARVREIAPPPREGRLGRRLTWFRRSQERKRELEHAA